jgi:fructosamine-3-kinase
MHALNARMHSELPDLPDGTHHVRLSDGRAAFTKIRSRAPEGFFAAEARGLAALRSAAALRVPKVFAVEEHCIALEELGNGRAGPSDWEQAGSALARLHALRSPQFGFDASGWCGDSAQDNTWDSDGFRFFAEYRLLPQARSAVEAGRLDRADARCVESVATRLREWLPQRPPVLVHGDLWLGNLHACADGELALIDGGAAHYGWAEGDLAMLTLFGEPPPVFFAAYETHAGIRGDWRERAAILNLYHLLNHLNLFGGAYLGAVRGILARFA